VTVYPYRNGDGVTTFNLPDCRGLVLAGRDNMGGTAAGRLTPAYFSASQNPDALGQQGGAQSQTLTQAMLPNVNFTVSIPSGQGSHSHALTAGGGAAILSTGGTLQGSYGSNTAIFATNIANAVLPAMSGTAASGGAGNAFSTTQPTLIANCMIRVLAKSAPIGGRVLLAVNTNLPDVRAIINRRRLAS